MTIEALDSQLAELSGDFRSAYLDYDALTEQLQRWADAFPELIALRSIGETEEGRAIWLVAVGREPERDRPATWLDGNMHAAELCGSSVSLAVIEDLLRLHLGEAPEYLKLAAPVVEVLRELLVYVVPRVSPDGAEAVLKTGRYVRSVPRDHRPQRAHARWISEDVDGDGLSLVMRVEDPAGEFVASPTHPNLLLPRRIEDPPPYYKVYPEGRIENFDGHRIPDPDFLSDNQTDLNRNFPWSWAPEPQQVGAGAYPTSEPESRALVDFATQHPNLFVWLNLHTFGGVHIRPCGHQPDNKMDPSDLAIFRQMEQWAAEFLGYPVVSGFEEFTYEPDKPLHGDESDYAYNQRGCIAWVTELWDLFARIEMARPKRFVDHYTQLTRDDLERLAAWDAEHNKSRAVLPWHEVEHPQLGRVEVGGLDPRFGFWNPPQEILDEVCQGMSAMYLRVASLVPRVVVSRFDAKPLGDGSHRVTLTVENHGYLPTFGLSSAKSLRFNEPLYVDVETEGCELASNTDAHREVGHLDGWGRGFGDGTGALYYLRSRGNHSRRTLEYVVRGSGTMKAHIGSCRVGFIEASLTL